MVQPRGSLRFCKAQSQSEDPCSGAQTPSHASRRPPAGLDLGVPGRLSVVVGFDCPREGAVPAPATDPRPLPETFRSFPALAPSLVSLPSSLHLPRGLGMWDRPEAPFQSCRPAERHGAADQEPPGPGPAAPPAPTLLSPRCVGWFEVKAEQGTSSRDASCSLSAAFYAVIALLVVTVLGLVLIGAIWTWRQWRSGELPSCQG